MPLPKNDSVAVFLDEYSMLESDGFEKYIDFTLVENMVLILSRGKRIEKLKKSGCEETMKRSSNLHSP